jgi:hypothetical protein
VENERRLERKEAREETIETKRGRNKNEKGGRQRETKENSREGQQRNG